MKRPAYPRTKPSGVEWLGDVPEHWETTRFRFCVRASNAGEVIDRSYWHSGEELLFSCQRESMISDFPDFPLRKRTTGNDLLVTRNGTPYVHVPPANAIYSNVVQRCTLKEGPLRSFVALALETACERLRGDGYGVSIPSFSYEKWCDLPLPLPPPAEQRSIAAFLNRETGRVDRLVAKKRELVERLKEKRTAVISRTVTRGLPPAAGLPGNSPFKPSGLDWLGGIPAQWEVKQLKRLGSIVSGYAFDSGDFTSSGVRVLKIANVQTLRLDWSDDSFLPEEFYGEHSAFAVRDGDVVFALTRPIISTGLKAAIAVIRDERILLNQRNALFRPRPEVSRHFIYHVLFCASFRAAFETQIDFTGQQPNISAFDIGNLKIAVPPLPEQTAIAAYLDAETAKLDALVGKVEEVMERLQEYRTALITAAVTGKIDVRNSQ